MSMEDIEKAMEKVIVDELVKGAMELEIPAEMAMKAYAVYESFVNYKNSAEVEGEPRLIDALMCSLIDISVFGTWEIEPERIRRIKYAWETIKEWIRDGEQNTGKEHRGV